MAARTPGSGPCTVSLLASLIAPGTVLPGTYAGSSAISGRRRAVISTAYVRPVYALLRGGSGSQAVLDGQARSGTLRRPGRRARAAEWDSLLMSCPPYRGPEVQILSPPPPVAIASAAKPGAAGRHTVRDN